MAKAVLSLSERIAERAKKKQKQARGGANRAEFLAVKEDVKKALDDQWPMKDIWETLRAEGAISFSYDAFMGYVRRLIKPDDASQLPHSPQKPKGKNLAAKSDLAAKSETVQNHTPAPNPSTKPSFNFNPKPKSRKE